MVDVETTGLDPRSGARICEVGVVRIRGDGTILDEYASLVDPQTPVPSEAREVNMVTAPELRGAPTFAQIAGDLLFYLRDAIVVGHNLPFEEKFFEAEFGRLGLSISGVAGLCTLQAARIQLDRFGYRLAPTAWCVTGTWPPTEHLALGDARSTALLLSTLLTSAPTQLSWWGPASAGVPEIPRTGFVLPRTGELNRRGEGWLSTIVARLPRMATPPAARENALSDYRALLAHCLADGRITGEEAARLGLAAGRAGLTQLTAQEVHSAFFEDARRRAEADGVVTNAELRELRRAAKELGTGHMIGDLEERAELEKARREGPLKGWRVLPIGGEDPALDAVMGFAIGHGATEALKLTKTVRLVVAASGVRDERCDSARSLGVPVAVPEEARRILEHGVAQPEQGPLFGSSEGAQVSAGLAEEQAAALAEEQAEAGSSWYEFWRSYELTPDQYNALFLRRQGWS